VLNSTVPLMIVSAVPKGS